MAAFEVVVLRRTWIPMLGWPMLALFVLANAARWWVIRTLGPRWNVQVMPAALGVITNRGPYRWVRHPNYAAVFLEMLALPLIHTALLTALAGAVAHVFVLRRRVALEESVMQRSPEWRAAFERRARFVPGLL
jgi:methyltransferase